MSATHPYQFGQQISADDNDIPMIVTAFEYRPTGVLIQATYWLNSKEESLWLPQWRTKPRGR